jgi:arsenate reductase (glutaredoxin)
MLNIGLDRENWALVLRPWYRIPDPQRRQQPGHRGLHGPGDATLIWNRNGHEVALMARHSLRTGSRSHGALQLDYGFPISNLLRGHVQVFDGYGEPDRLQPQGHLCGRGRVAAGVVLMDVTIWHNPACSNSRGALKLIRDAGFDPVVIEYLGNPPDAATLRQVLAESALTRATGAQQGSQFAELGPGRCRRCHPAGCDGRTPALINRPVVRTPKGTRLCRPPETVLEIL